MARQVHFEIFIQRGKPVWTLVDAMENRQDAVDAAKALLASGKAGAIRVVKETFDDSTGDFTAIKILEEGEVKQKSIKTAASEVGEAAPPCLTPEDFYSAHARQTLTRLFTDTLARWKVTVTELIHRADLLEKLEATGTLFQHAVQKVALAQADDGSETAVALIRKIGDLADKAIQRVYKEDRAGRAKETSTAAELTALVGKLAGGAEAGLAIGIAYAKYLAPAVSWDEKLDRTLAVLDALGTSGKAEAQMAALTDALVSEILTGASALQSLIGETPDYGASLIVMSDIYIGRPPQHAIKGSLSRLAQFFTDGKLPEARTALGRRVLNEIKTHKRLGASVEIEMNHLRVITSRMVMGPPQLVPHEDIVNAITLRSRHLVQPDSIAAHMTGAADCLEQALRLLALEENIIGAENKRRIWDFLRPILTGAPFESAMANAALAPITRLGRAADIQKRLLKSGIPEANRQEGAVLIDTIAKRHADPARFAPLLVDPARAPAVLQALKSALVSGAVPAGTCNRALAELLSKALKAA